MSAARREAAKTTVRNSWKDRLRSECFQRLRQERERILWASRGDKQQVHGALQHLIGDVADTLAVQHSQRSPGSLLPTSRAASAASRTITPPPAHAAGEPAAGEVGWEVEDLHRLEGTEYEELMQALESSLLEDRLKEEAAYVEMLEQQEVQGAVEAYLSHSTVPPGGTQQGGEAGVLCPLCRQAFLVQHRGVILCPRQDLRLDVSLENLTLDTLSERLAAALRGHGQQGCTASPSSPGASMSNLCKFRPPGCCTT